MSNWAVYVSRKNVVIRGGSFGPHEYPRLKTWFFSSRPGIELVRGSEVMNSEGRRFLGRRML